MCARACEEGEESAAAAAAAAAATTLDHTRPHQTRRTTGKRTVTSPERRKQKKLLPQVEHYLSTRCVIGRRGEARTDARLQVEVAVRHRGGGIFSITDDASDPEMFVDGTLTLGLMRDHRGR